MGATIFIILFVPSLYLATLLRSWGFELAAERAMPLVEAIQRYESTNGIPPSNLSALIPNYISELPSQLPPLELVTGKDAERNFYGNSWALVADVGTGVLNWDRFIYLPKHNYPEHEAFQRIRDWGDYHE
ncbi:MAG: hypothetical protein WA635_13690 [Gallionella sp.]